VKYAFGNRYSDLHLDIVSESYTCLNSLSRCVRKKSIFASIGF